MEQETCQSQNGGQRAGGGFWSNKINVTYTIALILQVLFIVLQFVPMMTITLPPNKVVALEVASGKYTSKASLFTVWGSEGKGQLGVFIVLTVGSSLGLLLRTIPYFIAYLLGKESKPKRFKLTQVFCLASMFLLGYSMYYGLSIAQQCKNDYGITNKLFSVGFGAYLYFIVGIALFIVQHILSVDAKNKRILAQAERLRKKQEGSV